MSRVSCSDFRQYIDPYLDGEFGEGERVEFDAHLAVCSECRRHFEQRAWFQRSMRNLLGRPTPMPGGARARLRFHLAQAAIPERRRRWVKRFVLPVPAMAAAAAVFLMVTPLTGFVPVVDDAVEQHSQKMPVEVPTPEVDQAEAWFEGKVPFELAAPRFRQDRISLLGGRLSHVGRRGGLSPRRAAMLLYSAGRHKVSVLVFDGQDLEVDSGRVREVAGREVAFHDVEGYRVALYRRGGLGYAVTSDLSEDKMADLLASAF